jgi:hypothetical protein
MLTLRRALAVLLGLGLAATAAAQTTTGRIAGTVADASGAMLPGATVTVIETRTGLTRSATTDTQGAYVFVNLPRGTYNVTAELSGFKRAARTDNELVADGRLSFDFKLEVGAMTETLEVTAPGEAVNASSGEIARTVDREQVQNLALNGRNYMQLATLIPGAPLLELNSLDIMTGLSINTSVNGSRNNASLLMVDGGFNMDSGSNNSQISNVGIDFIEEVNIKTANFSAEYGRNSGAAINVVTRSGGNEFHGSLFEYRRDEKLDANDTFSNRRIDARTGQTVERAPLDYNDFGWSLGGPIKRSRLFFFAGQEWKQIDRLTAPTGRTLPTRAQRAGNFGSIAIRDPLTNAPFPNNTIPANRITADGRAIANVYTAMEGLAASYTDTATANNAFFQDDNPFRFRQDMIRLDFQANDKHRLTLRVIHDNYDLEFPYGTFIDSQLPTVPTNRRRPGRNYQFSHSWTIKPTIINEFKAGASWNSQRIPPVGDAWKRETYGFTFPQIYEGGGRFENSIPDTTVQNYASFAGAARSLISPTTDISLSNNVSWINGAHTLKAGGLYIRNRKDQNGRSLYAGSLAFNPTGNPNSTGNAFADALLGNFRTYSEAQSDPMGFFRFSQVEAFISDNWRLSRTLSIEAGLRYTWHSPTHSQMNNMASFDPARYDAARAVTVNRNGTLVPGSGDLYNGMVRAGDGVPQEELVRVPQGNSPLVLSVPAGAPRGFYPNRHNIGPRFSFAWARDEKMAVRGGIGLFFDRPEGNVLFGGNANGPINNPPYILSSQYENGNLAAPGGGTVPALAPLAGLSSIEPNMTVPRSWNWSISVQRELVSGIFGEISYVGSRGSNLIRNPDINQASFEDLGANALLPAAQRANTNFLRPYKGYSNIFMVQSDGESSYKSFQLFLSRRKGSLRWTFSYTLSRSEDDGSANLGTGANLEDYTSKDFNDGPSTFDRTHVVVATWTYQLPFLRNNQGIAGRVLGGWEVSGIGRYQTGEPLTITGNTSIGERRADVKAGVDPYISELVNPSTGVIQWLNPEAFGAAAEGARGSSKRGEFRGPGFTVFDLSVRKQFGITNRVKLGVQADLFNALNHVNYRNPATVVTTAGFGTISQAAPSRNVQLGVRLTF